MTESAPTGLAELLAGLEDIVAPPPVDWLPRTPAAIATSCLFMILLGLSLFWLVRRYRANRYRREALRELDAIERGLADEDPEAPASIAVVLRRTALHIEARERVAGLSGEAWLHFLDDHAPGSDFTTGVGPRLLELPYAPPDGIAPNDPVVAELLARARHWIRVHRA